jgi:hypothetical protein
MLILRNIGEQDAHGEGAIVTERNARHAAKIGRQICDLGLQLSKSCKLRQKHKILQSSRGNG